MHESIGFILFFLQILSTSQVSAVLSCLRRPAHKKSLFPKILILDARTVTKIFKFQDGKDVEVFERHWPIFKAFRDYPKQKASTETFNMEPDEDNDVKLVDVELK